MSASDPATVAVVEPLSPLSTLRRLAAVPGLRSRTSGCRRLRARDRRAKRRSRACTRCFMRAARFEVARRRPTLPHLRGDELDDIATEAADDALMSVLRRLDDFRGASRFTTWAYKFALLEAAVKLGNGPGRDARCRSSPKRGALFSSASLEPDAEAEQSELLETLQQRDRRGAHAAPAARPRRARR